ncbi:MAG: J domain-containing protein [Bdellovibrio sp.]|nr:J domain-containing protein [Bdellovibrio sp.]
MVAKRDYYEILGISKQADEKQIKDAFRDLAMRYHPDRNKEPGAEERFKEIAEAYAILSDPDKKRQYDAHGFEGLSDFRPDDLFGGINFDEIFGDFGGPLFEHFFDRYRYQRRRGKDIEILVEVPLSKIMTGGSENINLKRKESCDLCHGSGAAAGSGPKTCDLCQGTGQTVASHTTHNMVFQQIRPCSKCHGKGSIIENPCSQCSGMGFINREKGIEVLIPPGVEDGTVLRIAKQGREGPIGNGGPGDLLVIIQTKKDPNFQRLGPDLFYSATIPVYDAVLGTKIQIPTLNDDVIVKVPSGTQAQTSLRVKGKGLPKSHSSGHGDLYVTIDIQIPEHLKSREKELFEELRAVNLDQSSSKTSWFARLRNNHTKAKSG